MQHSHLSAMKPLLLRDISASSLSSSVSRADTWESSSSNEARSAESSAPSSRSVSPDRKLAGRFRSKPETTIRSVSASLPNQPSIRNICFVGAGFVGGPTAALIAYHNPHITVNVVDLNTERIAAWNSAHLPIHENGLPKIVRIARDGTTEASVRLPGQNDGARLLRIDARERNLFFSTNVVPCVADADIIFICVNTPTKSYGVGAGASADLGALEAATRTIAKNAKTGAIIVEKSTVPCGTARIISDILGQYRPETNFEILSNPEFLAEGSAVANLMYPDRILIGSNSHSRHQSSTLSALQAAAALRSVYAAWVPEERILTVNTFSSELAKLIANAMLAQRISSINAVSALCEELGADVQDISRALGADSRLGPKFLQSGVGFGGSCFEKDILNLAYLARTLHLPEVADYWTSVLDINRYQRQRFSQTVISKLNGTLRGKKLAIFGFAFKDGTNDTRNSVAVHVIAELAAEMPTKIAIYDPGCDADEVMDEIRVVIKDQKVLDNIVVLNGWREAVKDASAVCILTQWAQFRGRHAQDESPMVCKAIAPRFVDHTIAVRDENPTEMDIIKVEKYLAALIADAQPAEDILQRLIALPDCEEDCRSCQREAMLADDKDIVDWEEVASAMEQHSWVFDGRNIVDGGYLRSIGFKVHSIGKGIW